MEFCLLEASPLKQFASSEDATLVNVSKVTVFEAISYGRNLKTENKKVYVYKPQGTRMWRYENNTFDRDILTAGENKSGFQRFFGTAKVTLTSVIILQIVYLNCTRKFQVYERFSTYMLSRERKI